MNEWYRRAAGKSRHLRGGLATVSATDRAVTAAVANRPYSGLDVALRRLTRTADHSILWAGIAAILAARRGASRKAALRGMLSIALTSGLANAVLKPSFPRRRPAAAELPDYRRIPDPPTSSSFPSGHAASAAAFATAVALENRKVAPVVVPLAAAVAYSRVHVGVHWASDVLVGAGIGSAVALATQRWWPVRTSDEARARPVDTVPELPRGEGLVIVANPYSGPPDYDASDDVAERLPAAHHLVVREGVDLVEELEKAVAERGSWVRALGVAGGDGTVAAVASVADRHGLPLVVVPAGTLNHFARDVGVYDTQEAVDATQAGEAVAVDLALVEAHPGKGDDPEDPAVTDTRYFLNTASVGSYPELVRLREQLQNRWGKWPAFAFALVTVLHRSERVKVRIADEWHDVWFIFVGNGPYYPRGAVPAWRPTLDSGLLDVRWLAADVRFSRLRVLGALLLGALGHSRVYHQMEVAELDVELAEPSMLATDGEIVTEAGRYTFRVAPNPIPVYRRDEERWSGRSRPFQG
ncbi:bifunctional phosphatase PAP2/diacylglycerol kinase family protein [Pseudonocardia endophytica]|uniref:Undecaprenyl-diphosphatase n=1 Tax=Pseudonocardia endophytica TaxID=401976 RepID=A0A4R1HNZ0_PSEEN|nr:phosphatase PAP2 family protein [Pseudonocardia endophytica]TCK24234.1 undecaprenyl-diphosphatase [Pseudonocardia endophytica]